MSKQGEPTDYLTRTWA